MTRPPGSTPSFGVGPPEPPRSVAAFTEAELAEWLFGSDGPGMPQRPARRILGLVLGIPPLAPVRLRTPTTLLVPDATAPGDIDALVAAPGDEARALAFECKPVKVKADTFATGRPNRLPELEHGAHQANALAVLGFHRVHLLVAAAVDGRVRPGNALDRGPTADIERLVYASLPLDLLDPRVGLAVVWGVQWGPKPVYDAGGIGLAVMRQATPQAQPLTLTAAIRRLLAPAQAGVAAP